MAIFRPQRGSFSDSMAESKECNTLTELLKVLNKTLECLPGRSATSDNVRIEFYCNDGSGLWESTFIVTVMGFGPMGFISEMVK